MPGSSWKVKPAKRSPLICSRSPFRSEGGVAWIENGLVASRLVAGPPARACPSACGRLVTTRKAGRRPAGPRRGSGRGEVAVAVADREDGRDQLDVGPGRGGLDPLGIAEIGVDDAVEDLELVVGESAPRYIRPASPADQVDHLVGRLIDLEIGRCNRPNARHKAMHSHPMRITDWKTR